MTNQKSQPIPSAIAVAGDDSLWVMEEFFKQNGVEIMPINAGTSEANEAEQLAEQVAAGLQQAEAALPRLLGLSREHEDKLTKKLLKRGIRELDAAHLSFWAACRAAGMNEGGK